MKFFYQPPLPPPPPPTNTKFDWQDFEYIADLDNEDVELDNDFEENEESDLIH